MNPAHTKEKLGVDKREGNIHRYCVAIYTPPATTRDMQANLIAEAPDIREDRAISIREWMIGSYLISDRSPFEGARVQPPGKFVSTEGYLSGPHQGEEKEYPEFSKIASRRTTT
ncbi:hypothetical protein NMY22_g3337 [Coprinellus aureogranulatus]|nr:hypothetical protein NMY22_g3337 [Coprinellus aureogranulatus]